MKYCIYSLILFLLCSCAKENVERPDFDVLTDKQTFKEGDTVLFQISGKPDFITFYSGEEGNNYENRNKTEAEGTSFISFSSKSSSGALAKQVNTLRLMYSADFNGKYDADNVANSTWIDITNRATLTAGVVTTTSGNIDVSDLRQNKNVYFAFKYIADKSTTLYQPSWTITLFVLNSYLLDDTRIPVITNTNEGGWVSVGVLDAKETAPIKWVVSSGGLTLADEKLNVDPVEQWAISKNIDLKSVPPDRGVGIKNINTDLSVFPYVFDKEGVYTVSFLAKNQTIYGEKEILKQITITVEK